LNLNNGALSLFINLRSCHKEQFKKGASMTGREILKVLVSCLLIGCFLIGNITYAYASSSDPSTNSDSYENNTEISEEELQPSEEEAQDSEEDVQSSEDHETLTKDNEEASEDADTQSSENTEANSTENTEKVSSQDTKTEVSYNIVHSEYTKIENNQYVQKESESTGLSKSSQKSSQELPPSASVSLHGEKTEVVSGEDILLRLSAVNLITKPTMHVQVIIIPPSGMMVSSSEFVQSGAGQYTTTYELEPGQGRDIEVRIESGQVGDFNVEGRVVYYFGDNIKNAEDYTLKLPIKVEANTPTVDSVYKTLPGFTLEGLVFVLMTVLLLRRR
jgi:hypothetical protein